MKTPITTTEQRGIIGLLNWQRHFIPSFSTRIRSFQLLLKQPEKILLGWTALHELRFKETKY